MATVSVPSSARAETTLLSRDCITKDRKGCEGQWYEVRRVYHAQAGSMLVSVHYSLVLLKAILPSQRSFRKYLPMLVVFRSSEC